MKKHIPKIIAVLLILFLGVVFQKKFISDFPNYTHAWAQSDRYALALGFVENDLNFFKPETKVLNHQFPKWWLDHSTSSVTAVDFPIHDYIPAVVMKITGNNSPMIFRVYILLYSFIGLFFLFKLTHVLTTDFYKSIFVVLFAATSPVFIYYQNGFLPTIPSLANAIIGFYCYVIYLQNGKNKSFAWALFFLTLAALSRTTFAIPLIALVGLEVLRTLIYKVSFYKKIVAIVVSFSCIVLYMLYNSALREEYGSLFLNHLMMPTSFAECKELVMVIADNWLYHYFSKVHYLVAVVLLLAVGFFVAIRKVKLEKIQLQLLAFIVIYFVGCLMFAFLMLQQFPAHDYYFLDTFYLPCILIVILLIVYIPLPTGKVANSAKLACLGTLFFLFVQIGRQSQWDQRITGDWDRTSATIKNYEDADQFLDLLKIPKDARILALDVSAPNIPFILMDRKGYAQLKNRYHILKKMIAWNPDYVVFENEYFMANTYSNYPAIISKITKIGDNGKITICKINKKRKPVSLAKFLGIDKKVPLVQEVIDFEKELVANWSNMNLNSEKMVSGKWSHKLAPSQEFGITFKTTDFPVLTKSGTVLAFEAQMNYSLNKNFEVIVSIIEKGETRFYKSVNLGAILKKKNTWQKVNLLFYLPKVEADEYEFALYLLNKEKGELFVDDLNFKVYN